jgi:hypothetical protein
MVLIRLITNGQFVSRIHSGMSYFVLISLSALPIPPASGSAPPKAHYTILTASEYDIKRLWIMHANKNDPSQDGLRSRGMSPKFEVTVPI